MITMRFSSRIFLLVAALFLVSLPTFAGLANPNTTVTLGDADRTFKARIVGDEWVNYVEKDGYTLLRNPQNEDRWEYAKRNHAGDLVPSGFAAFAGDVVPQGLTKHLRPVADYHTLRARHFPTAYSRSQDHGFGRAKNSLSKYEPSLVSGPRNLLFIRVQFNDRNLNTSADAWDSMIFDQTAGAKTIANYYQDNSFGHIQMEGVPHAGAGEANGIVTVSLNMNHPNSGLSNLPVSQEYAQEIAWVNAALAEAANVVDFPALDTNRDGSLTLDEAIIYFIVAGYDAASSANEPNVWGHKWSAWTPGDVMAGSVQLPSWAMNGELFDDGTQHSMGVIAHELGHLMCGLPDLYDINNQNLGMGLFSLMAAGSWGYENGETPGATPTNMDAWCRYILGWSTPRGPGNGTLTFEAALTDAYTPVKFAGSRSYEYFLAENRAPIGWDRGMMVHFGDVRSQVIDGGTTLDSNPMAFSPTGTVTNVALASGLGRVGDFPNAANYIALIERGEISFADKVKNAKAAGAAAVIVYQNLGNEGPIYATLSGANAADLVPAIGMMRADGLTLAGKQVTMSVIGGSWEGGILIQHIDTTIGTVAGNDINSSANARQGVTVVEATSLDGSLLASGGSGGHDTHLFSAQTASAWHDNTTPSARYYDGSATGFALYGFSEQGVSMTASTTPINQAPTAAFTCQIVGLNLNLTSTSSDAEGAIAQYAWDFGDGTGATTAHPSHTYSSAGSYTVSLTVTDNQGVTHGAALSVTVSDAVPSQAQTSTTTASIGANGSQDFTIVVAGGTVSVEATWKGKGEIDLFLINPNGVQVAAAAGGANPATINFDTNGVAGTYTIRCRNNASRAKSIALTVSWLEPL